LRLLLDTHTFLWWVFADPKLSRPARTAIADSEENRTYVSAATAWEISTKFRIGKLPDAAVVAEDISGAVSAEGFHELAISFFHADRAGALAGEHRDPFDRMIIAQAMLDDLVLVSNDRVFDRYAVKRLW
jgi:PIN domain nuclease of toxin-antitoxin system